MSMSHYGSTGNLSLGNRQASPSYASLQRNQDEYNRFETKRHHDRSSEERRLRESNESKFSGYGNRPGTGVEMTEHRWTGGELITDPSQLPKSLKPRRMFYSPIGDGVVAADGVEKKRGPVDLTPRVTITTLSKIDRGERGQGGVNVYEKEWHSTLPGEGAAGSVFDGNFPNIPDGVDRGNRGPHTDNGSGLHGPAKPTSVTPNTGLGGRGGPSGPGGPGRGSGLGEPYPAYPAYEEPVRPLSSASTFDPYRVVDTKTGYLITNPRELIHQFATTTPIATMGLDDGTPLTKHTSVKSMYSTLETQETEQRFAPYAPYRVQNGSSSHGGNSGVVSPNRFVRNLRDETMTHSQREANTHLDALNQRDPNSSHRVQEIRQKTMHRGGNDDIDQLTNQLVHGLNARY
ncbi:unnamed protein product, partial [Mesorhabditis spiculigera]